MTIYTFNPARAPRLKPVSDTKHREDGSCPDGGWKRLTKNQKSRLAILAREAFAAQKVIGVSFEDWRHDVAIRACGNRISEATQSQWADLKAAFQDLAGQPDKALNTHLRDADNKRRVAMHKLTTALTERGLDMSYAASISRTQFKCELDSASAKQLWCLFFTVTNRRSKKP